MINYMIDQLKFIGQFLIGCIVIYTSIAVLSWDTAPNMFTYLLLVLWTILVWGIYFLHGLWRKNG